MSYKFLSTIQAISATFTGNSVYSNSTPNRTVKVDATGLYLSRTSDGAYPSSITANGSMYYDTRNSHIFRNDGTASMTLFDNTRNVGIGTTTDAGYKLDVNGTFRVQYGTVERGAIFTHSNGTYAEIVLGNGSAAGVGVVEIHRNGTSAISLRSNAVLFNTSRLVTPSTFFVTGPYGGSSIGTSVRLASNTVDQGVYTATSGTQNTVVIGNSGNEIWQPSSGNATYNLFSVLPSINTSGTYAGIVRGFYYSPTLTSITGVTHRAIETVTGDVIFGSTSGNVGIGTTAPGGKLQVNGSVTASGAVARGTYITNTLVAAANNDVLVGLDITPTFTNGAFTGVTNWGLRVASPIQVTYDSTSVSGLNLNTTVGTVGIFNNISFTTSGILRGAFGINNQSGEFRWNSTSGGYYPTIYSNGLERMRIPTTGNVLIGTTTDAGYKLDVNGTAVVRGIFYAGTTNTGLNFSGADCNIFNSGGSAGNISFSLGGNKYLNIDQITGSSSGFTSGTFNTFLTARTYSWSSGTAISNVFSITPTVNNTSTYTGTFRGIYYNPTLTSLTGTTHRAIETTLGDVLFGTTSGSVGIGANTSINASAILDVTSTTKGFLPPRMTNAQRTAITSPAVGLIVYQTDSVEGVYVYTSGGWKSLTMV